MHFAMTSVQLCHIVPGIRRDLKNTLSVYRDACCFIADVINIEWASLQGLGSHERTGAVEALIHKTKANPVPLYDFDGQFVKFPSYYRRSAIQEAYGVVASYYTRLAAWQEELRIAMASGKPFKKRPPRLVLDCNYCPCMYNKEMFCMDGNTIRLKVYTRNTWDWITVSIPSRDYKSLQKRSLRAHKVCAPQLVFKYNTFYLQFPIQYKKAEFAEARLEDQTVLSVDLGINHGAVASVCDYYGTIHARIFDGFNAERDHINHLLQILRYKARRSGKGQSLSAIYTKLAGVKDNYVKQLAHFIVEQAVKYHVYGIVFEYLGSFHGKSRTDKIHHWCKRRIQEIVKGMALRNGIRVYFINPKNTSAHAYDGSGKVTRDKNNYSLCTFATGKKYHCDLNASYNIGARYFLRAIQKAMPSGAWEQIEAKVPVSVKRTDQVLNTLRVVTSELCSGNGKSEAVKYGSQSIAEPMALRIAG